MQGKECTIQRRSEPSLGGRVGYLFEGTLRSGVCFVPEECVEFRKDGPVEIDEARYLLGGWAKKNALSNPGVLAHRLFPDPRSMLGHTESAEIKEFLRQLEPAKTG